MFVLTEYNEDTNKFCLYFCLLNKCSRELITHRFLYILVYIHSHYSQCVNIVLST